MLWYRAYEGLVSDPKLHEIALDCKVSRSLVIAVWHSLLESCASEESERFSTTSRRISINLHEKIEKIEKILKSFSDSEMIVDGCVFRWNERQFVSDSSTPRVKRYREKRKRAIQPPEQPQGRNVTETLHETEVERFGNAPEKNIEEHRKEEQNRNTQRGTRAVSKVFIHPSLLEISEYCKERNNHVNPEVFFDHYEANGWKVGKNPMKDWKASVRTWEKSEFTKTSKSRLEDLTDPAEILAYLQAEEAEKSQPSLNGANHVFQTSP